MDAVNAESAVIGILIREPDALDEVLGTGIEASDFMSADLRDLFVKMLSLDAQGSRWDLPTLGAMVAPGKLVQLVEIVENAPLTQNASTFARELHRSSRRRRAVAVLSEGVRRLASHEAYEDDSAVWAELEAAFTGATVDELGNSLATAPAAEVFLEVGEEYEAAKLLHQEGKLPGWTTGFPGLDALTGGFRREGLYVVGARPGMGKTALCVHFALTASHAGANVVFFTIEMSRKMIGQRIAANHGLLPTGRIMDGDLTEEMEDRLFFRLAELGQGTLTVNDRAGGVLEQLEAECRRLKRLGKLDVVIVDYVQLMRTTARHHHRTSEITEITNRLKALAKGLNIVIIAAAQINREAAKAQDKRPTMAQLKDSGSFEQDGDAILLIHRPSYYNEDGGDELILAKNRHGVAGMIRIESEMRCSKFKEIN